MSRTDNGWHPYILAHTSASVVTLDPCTPWVHVDVGVGPQYPAPRFSNMVPTTHVREAHRLLVPTACPGGCCRSHPAAPPPAHV